MHRNLLALAEGLSPRRDDGARVYWPAEAVRAFALALRGARVHAERVGEKLVHPTVRGPETLVATVPSITIRTSDAGLRVLGRVHLVPGHSGFVRREFLRGRLGLSVVAPVRFVRGRLPSGEEVRVVDAPLGAPSWDLCHDPIVVHAVPAAVTLFAPGSSPAGTGRATTTAGSPSPALALAGR